MHALPARVDTGAPARAPARSRCLAEGAAVPATLSPTREMARRRVVRLVFLIYTLAIFEGALRKYVLPQFGQYIFFIRDPFLLWAYVIAARWKLWPRGDAMLRIALWGAGLGAVLLILQMAFGLPSDFRLLLGAYGWRAYFFYVPLAFLVGAQFSRDDLMRLAKWTLLLAVPIALLVAAQFFSPPDAMVNVGTAEDKLLQFRDLTIDTAHVRPAGPFSSNAGLQQFATTAFALLLGLAIMPSSQRRLGMVTLLAGGGAVLTCIALSGSRGTIVQTAMILVFSLPVALLGRGTTMRTRAALIPIALGIAAVVLYPILFPEGFAAFTSRWDTAARDESGIQGGVFGRALIGFVDFTRLIDAVPPLGFGLGFGGNAAILMKATIDGVQPGAYAETDYARHMVDLGVACGVAYIVFRFAFVLWLLRRVLRATRRSASPLPMMLFAYAGYVTLLGQITGNGSINVYGWLFTGLCLAACRVATAPVPAFAPAAPPAARMATRPRAPRGSAP
jgi:hypothetical protein